jgi:VIT1/CCC1 family predicted Fe2+/Mn2+ transporter
MAPAEKFIHASMFRPAIFGTADGMMSALGSILFLLHYQGLIVPVALLGGLSAGMSMAYGEMISDNDRGWREGVVMGVATLAGTFAPAVPFTVGSGVSAFAAMVAICLAVGAFVGWLRAQQSPQLTTLRAVTVTLAGLIMIFAVTYGLSLVIHGGVTT